MAKKIKEKQVQHLLSTENIHLTNLQLVSLTLVLAFVYIGFSFSSDGFYQHDEAAHFINMRTFWYNPAIILGNWAKPGYKLLYVIPSLAGPFAVLILNALFAAGTSFFVYKTAQLLSIRIPFVAFFLLATQPLWIQLSFRNYSEIPTAFLLSLACWLYYRKQQNDWWFVALILSYLTLLRQEFYVIVVVFAVWLIIQKEWKYILVLPVFPLLIHCWGWIATNDPLYLLTSTLGTAGTYKDAYPRLGFDHYFKMMIVITGPLVLLGFLLSVRKWIQKEADQKLFPMVVVALVYFLLHALFNWQSVKIGTSTGGNLRYMLVISPLLSLLATIGLESVATQLKDKSALVIAALFMFVTLVFLSYENNTIVFTQEKDFTAVSFVALFLAVLFVLKPSKIKVLTLVVLQLVFLILTVKPYKKSSQDALMEKVVSWAEQQQLFSKPTLTQHILFYYYRGKVQHQFEGGNVNTITQETIAEAKPGSIIFWDSHYSYRPKLRPTSVDYTWFLDKSNEFKPLRQFISPDKRFGVFVFEKLK